MPELPEAETIARGLSNQLVGWEITGVKNLVPALRNPLNLRKLQKDLVGAKVTEVTRRGKGIIVKLENGKAVLMQLGMTGACRICPTGTKLLKHERLIFHLDNGLDWRYEDIRKFGNVQSFTFGDENDTPEFLRSLGVEPLGTDFSGKFLFERTRKRICAVKELLLNQKIVAGIGNIYVSELLYRAKVRPQREAGTVTRREADLIVDETKSVLLESIAAGGTTISDYKALDGTAGKFEQDLRVYGEAGLACAKCGKLIEKITIGGRSTFYCPRCQR